MSISKELGKIEKQYRTEEQLLIEIYLRCAQKPNFINRVIKAATDGMQKNAEHYKEMAMDMETVASIAFGALSEGKRVTKKTKEFFEKLALEKLEKYEFKTFHNWKWAIKEKEK